jgi:hypothetical protein
MNLLQKNIGAYAGPGPEGRGGLYPLGNKGSGHLNNLFLSDFPKVFLNSSTPVFHIKTSLEGGPENNR